MTRRQGPVMTSALLLAAVATGGCSAIFTKGPPPDHAYTARFDCSTSYAPPILDTIWAGLNGAGAAIALSKSDAEWKRTQTNDRAATIAVGLTWLAVSGASAIYGYKTVSDCHEAREPHRRPRFPLPVETPPPPPARLPPPAPPPAADGGPTTDVPG
jgi:hypothetical protein